MLRPAFQLLTQKLLSGNLVPGFKLEVEPAQVTISVPRSHPHADKLVALAQMLATRRVYNDGIEIDHGADDEAVNTMLMFMREIGKRTLTLQLLEEEDVPATKEKLELLEAGLYSLRNAYCSVLYARIAY